MNDASAPPRQGAGFAVSALPHTKRTAAAHSGQAQLPPLQERTWCARVAARHQLHSTQQSAPTMAPVLSPAELPLPAACASWYKSAGSSAPSAPASMHQEVCRDYTGSALPAHLQDSTRPLMPGPDACKAASQVSLSALTCSHAGTSSRGATAGHDRHSCSKHPISCQSPDKPGISPAVYASNISASCVN